jgi:uncharacterized membrane protein YbhN (UPF0104 family)
MASELAAPHTRTPLTRRAWWPAAKRTATLLFLVLVAWLLVTQARSVEWDKVLASIRAYPLHLLLISAAMAIASYALYCSFDLVSRHYSGHTLSTRKVLLTTFISYAFNLNLGSLVGGLGLRFRLYSQLGLGPDVISRIYGFTMLTNWSGYVVLAGVLCLVQPIDPPPQWALGSTALRVVGLVLLSLAAGYIALCGLSRKRSWTLRGHELRLPSLRVAMLQLPLSCATWMAIASVIYPLLQHRTGYATVLTVLLLAAIAGVVTHVPAGLGVIEAVFITLLSPQIAKSELLAAVLVFRAVYYLMPLAVATVLFVLFEMNVKKPPGGQADVAG